MFFEIIASCMHKLLELWNFYIENGWQFSKFSLFHEIFIWTVTTFSFIYFIPTLRMNRNNWKFWTETKINRVTAYELTNYIYSMCIEKSNRTHIFCNFFSCIKYWNKCCINCRWLEPSRACRTVLKFSLPLYVCVLLLLW